VTHLPRRHGKQSAANVHVILKALVNFVGFGGNFGMSLDQSGLYPADDEAPTFPVLADRATKRSSQQTSLK